MDAQLFCSTGNSHIKKVRKSPRKWYVRLDIDETNSDIIK